MALTTKLPQQPRDIDPQRRALAPYNFVPLPERVLGRASSDLPGQDRCDAQRLCGFLDCELTTASPLYIRAGRDAQDGRQAKDKPEFFYVRDADQPTIPGSSLRGVLRAMLEIAAFGKVDPVTNRHLAYRAVGDTTSHGRRYRERLMRDDGQRRYTPLARAGYLRKQGDGWEIQPARELDGTSYAVARIDERLFKQLRPVDGCRNAFEIYVRADRYDYQPVRGGFLKVKYAPVLHASAHPGAGLVRGTLAKSGWIGSKRTEVVVYEEEDHQTARPLPLSDDLVEDYRMQLTPEQEQLLGNHGVLNEGQPVFYLLGDDGSVEFFGHCRMFRLPYPNSPQDYVPARLREDREVDLAGAMFGYVRERGEGKARSYASRVFVSDATLLPGQKDLWLIPSRTVIPKILGGPKPTTFQHYLVQRRPNKEPAGRTRDGRERYSLELSDYASPIEGETVIRGHKLYWHKGDVDLEAIREPSPVSPKDTQHTRTQPLRSGLRFRFRIDFDQLSEVELGALLWVLDTAADERYRLKLGMGKPLGLGAVAIEARLHLIDRQARYRRLFAKKGWNEATAEDASGSRRREAVAAFERWVLDGLDVKDAGRIDELDRVRSLLTLLSWPGPSPADTRYLEIEHWEGKRKVNEYRERPVLPVPGLALGQARPAVDDRRARPAPEPRAKPEAGYRRGIVKEFGRTHGFIELYPEVGNVNEEPKLLFVHQSQLRGGLVRLLSGVQVRFRIGKGLKGNDEAQDVEPID